MRRVPLKPIYFLLRIHQETFDTKRKLIPEIFESGYGKFAIRQCESHTFPLVIGPWLAFSGLARSAGTVVFPLVLGLGESVLAFPLTTRLTLHLFCR